MNHLAWIDARLAKVRVADVRSYLLGKAWKVQPYPGPELLVFGGPVDDNGEPVVQVLPSSEHFRDFSMRLEELLASLSVMEGRPAAEIVTDVLAVRASEG